MPELVDVQKTMQLQGMPGNLGLSGIPGVSEPVESSELSGIPEILQLPELTDMHAHLSCIAELEEGKISRNEALKRGARELAFRRSQGIRTFVSTGRPWEWELARDLTRGPAAALTRISFGIHPWYADQFDPADYAEYFRACDAVGEIGMDAVWCEIPLSIQQKRLEWQLQTAADLKKPVVLHTKGCETRIAEILRGFPGKILIHWFSGTEEELERFLELDCYFSLGPDLAASCFWKTGCAGRAASDTASAMSAACFREPVYFGLSGKADAVLAARLEENACSGQPEKAALYRAMLCKIPGDRLFLETDGRAAVEWALGRPVPETEIPGILRRNLCAAAAAKQCSEEAFAAALAENCRIFLQPPVFGQAAGAF